MKKFVTTALTIIIALSIGTIVLAADAKVKLVNINTATETQLKSIPGVNDEVAKKIVAGRPYRQKGELKSKEIVTTDLYEKITKLITSVC